MTSRALPTLALLTALLGACSSSSSDETSDAGPPSDAASRDDAAAVHDAGVDVPPQPVFSADAGSTWTALYGDYFGNDTAVHTAGCSNGNYCHGSTASSSSGYVNSLFLCPKGDKEACYKSLTSQDRVNGPQLIAADAGWDDDYLSMTLCEVDDTGNSVGGGMPYDCVYNFRPTDIARIKVWIAAGYPDN